MSNRPGRKMRRSKWEIAGGRDRAEDRGRAPKTLEARDGRTVKGLSSEYVREQKWKATGSPQWVTRAENREKAKRAKKARKKNRR